MTALPPRSPRLSTTEMTEIVLPQHANALGSVFGGTVMSWIDIAAAVAAQRHCGRVAVTAAVDELVFRAPIRVGNVVRLVARVNAAFRTSLEVSVVVEAEQLDGVRRTAVDALLTFVCVGPDGTPTAVPGLLAESDDDRTREEGALRRRQERLARKRDSREKTS